MKYDLIQKNLEKYVQDTWCDTAIQFDNVAFNSDLYDEYVQFTVTFGDAKKTTVTNGCYRQIGLAIFTVYQKPAQGTTRLLKLADKAASMFRSKIVRAVPVHAAPAVNLMVPDLYNDKVERDGWVRAQLSTPFYYDFVEI